MLTDIGLMCKEQFHRSVKERQRIQKVVDTAEGDRDYVWQEKWMEKNKKMLENQKIYIEGRKPLLVMFLLFALDLFMP